jgi:hypothetical protein
MLPKAIDLLAFPILQVSNQLVSTVFDSFVVDVALYVVHYKVYISVLSGYLLLHRLGMIFMFHSSPNITYNAVCVCV